MIAALLFGQFLGTRLLVASGARFGPGSALAFGKGFRLQECA